MDLKSWNQEVFGSVLVKKLEAFNKIGFQDAKEREGPLIEAKRVTIEEYDKQTVLKETSWRQKLRDVDEGGRQRYKFVP